MPAPVYRGTFPVLKSYSWEKTKDGKFIYTVVNAYRAGVGVVTGTLGTPIATLGRVLYLSSIDVSTKNSITEVIWEYTSSIAGASASPSEQQALTIYEASAVLSEEPIASHPAFTAPVGLFSSSIVSASGGSLTEGSSASGGTIFSEEGIFVGFSKNANNNFFGVQSYLAPRVTFRKTYSKDSPPSVSYSQKVSYIYNNPDPEAPSLTGSKNWLFTNLSWRNSGGAGSGLFEITEEYTASGINGWNNVIYKDSGS